MPPERDDEPSADDPSIREQLAAQLETRARESSEIGDHEAALEFYSQCLALAPSAAWRYHLRANARASLGDVDGALDDFSRAIAFGHTDYRVFHDRGLHRSQVGDESGALEDYSTAIEKNATAPEPRNNRAMIFLRRGELDRARDDLLVAVANLENVAVAPGIYHCSLAEVLCALGALDEAELALRAAIALDPQWREYARTADELRALRGRVDD